MLKIPRRAVAEDLAGNRSEAAVTVNVVRSPLTLTLSTPTENAAVRTATIDVAGNVRALPGPAGRAVVRGR